MKLALMQAHKNLGNTKDNPAVGGVIVKNDCIMGSGTTGLNGRPHAEYNAINSFKKNIKNSDLYVTLEPCVMCGGASFWTQIKRIVYGSSDEKRGFSTIEESILHPKTQVTKGIHEEKCSKILHKFFQNKRT